MTPYKIVPEGEGFYTVKDVPIFECHDTRGFNCDEQWMAGAIQNFEREKAGGYRPTVIVGHNVKGTEKRAYGFLDNFHLKDKKLYADLVRVPKELKEDLIKNAYPSRSVEVLPQSKRILALALLGGTTPFFTLPQMVYENQEQSTWYRSPIMPSFTDEQKNELNQLISQAVASSVPEALKQYSRQAAEAQQPKIEQLTRQDAVAYLQANPDAEIYEDEKGTQYLLGQDGTYYQLPGEPTQYGVMDIAKQGLGIAKNVGSAALNVAKNHPGAIAGTTAGYMIGKSRGRKQQATHGYQIDDQTGVVYFDGKAIGEVVQYEGQPVPSDIEGTIPSPTAGTAQPILNTDPGDDENTALQQEPGFHDNMYVEELNRQDSDQFQRQGEGQAENAELYQLQREVSQLKYANDLLQAGRKAEEYKQYLLGLKQKGTPIGDIEQTLNFMMSQNAEQVAQFKKVLEAAPKVELGPAQYSLNAAPDLNEAKSDFQANRDTYTALGVSDKDLQYAKFVRVNQFAAAGSNGRVLEK